MQYVCRAVGQSGRPESEFAKKVDDGLVKRKLIREAARDFKFPDT